MAATYDTELDQGATFKRTFAVNDGADAPIDLTGYSFAGQVRKLPKDTGTALATFTTSIGGVDNNEVTISLTPTQTSALPYTADAKDPLATNDFYYDLEMTEPSLEKTRLVMGKLTMSPEVTK